MTDSLVRIADIVQAKARAAECNEVPKPCGAKLHQIETSMEKPLDAVQIAQAYLSSQDLRKQFPDDGRMHLIMLLLRDLLLLSVCMEVGNLNNHLLQQKLTNVFNGRCLNETERSQLLQAFNKIKTFGKSRAEFNKNLGLSVQEVPPGVEAPRKKQHPYKDLNAAEQNDIYKAFSDCAKLSPGYRSNNSKRKCGKGRERKLSSPQNNSSGKVVQGFSDDLMNALEEQLQGMQHEFSLLKKQQEQSVKLDAASLWKIAEHNNRVAQCLQAYWTWESHASIDLLHPNEPLSV